MATTFTDGTTILYPTVVDGWDASRRARNIIHDVLGRADPDVTLRPAGLRSGKLRLVFADEADAMQASNMHAQAATFQLVSTDRDHINMTYVATDEVRLTLDDATRDAWVVEVGYQEVSS